MGSGVFDGFMAYWNRDHWHLHLPRSHLNRFLTGCRRMDLSHRWTVERLERGVLELLAGCPKTTHYIRPIAYRPQPEILLTPSRSLPVTVCMFGVGATRDDDRSLTAQVSSVTRVSSAAIPVRWKVCGAYANSFIAQTRAEEKGFDTAIFLDRERRVCEASVANLFFVADRGLVTPRLDADVFPGLTRSLLLRLAAELGIAVSERPVRPEELARFEGAFVCSTLTEIRPLRAIDGVVYASASHPLVRRLLAAFRDLTHERSAYPA
ncbi:MAG TPA: aminotransferase class IV [Solirubrobacterales bacterium]|nr:aminotransferase class IV [Solirubrobacterales bacterium]